MIFLARSVKLSSIDQIGICVMRLEVLFVFVLGLQNVSCYCIKPAGQ